MFVSMREISLIVHLRIPKLYVTTGIAKELIALIPFEAFSTDSRTILIR